MKWKKKQKKIVFINPNQYNKHVAMIIKVESAQDILLNP